MRCSRLFHTVRRAALIALAAVVIGAGTARTAAADPIPYPNAGVYNPITYSFTAAATGDIVAYIVGGFGAGFTNELGLLVNGVDTGVYGLNNHSSALGDSINFGSVMIGDVLTFVLRNISLNAFAYSNASLNAAYDGLPVGTNHVYSTAYTATSPVFGSVPVGTYVAFEDLPFGNSDYNYNDESFVFTNVQATQVPEPTTLALAVAGLAGFALRRRAKRSA